MIVKSAYSPKRVGFDVVRDDRLAELLEVAIAGRGAFRRFKDVLAGFPDERERWFAWRDGRQRERDPRLVGGRGDQPGQRT